MCTRNKQNSIPLTDLGRWFPFADWDTLKTLALYTIWLFLWDDSVDTAEHDLADDIVGANEYRTETICVFKKYVGGAKWLQNVQVDGINGVIETFAHRLSDFFNSGQRSPSSNKPFELRFHFSLFVLFYSCMVEHLQKEVQSFFG